MSALVISDNPLAEKSDRELLEAMVKSQMRVEEMVSGFLETAKPILEKVSRGGIMGLMGMGK